MGVYVPCIANTYLTHYCVIRSDLPFGAQAAQLIHAAGQSIKEPISEGTYAIALHVKTEAELRSLSDKLRAGNIEHELIVESDEPYSGQAMAIGIRPMDRQQLKPYLSSLPLVRYKAPLAQSNRASGVMTQKVGSLNLSGRATHCGLFQRIRRWFTG